MKAAILFLAPLTALHAEPQTTWDLYQQAHETAERWREKFRQNRIERELKKQSRILEDMDFRERQKYREWNKKQNRETN